MKSKKVPPVGRWLCGMMWARMSAARLDWLAFWLTKSEEQFEALHVASTHRADPHPTCGATSLLTAYGTSHLIRDVTSRNNKQVLTQI